MTQTAPDVTSLPGQPEPHPMLGDIEILGQGRLLTGRFIIDSQELWDYFREQLLNRPMHVAERTGLPELANWKYMKVPGKPIALSEIWNFYDLENTSDTKAAAKRNWDRMVKGSPSQ